MYSSDSRNIRKSEPPIIDKGHTGTEFFIEGKIYGESKYSASEANL